MFILLSFIGILAGILIARYTKEELKEGKKYFIILERICLILISLILISNYKISWVVLLGLIAGYFLNIIYLVFGLTLVLTNNMMLSIIVFIYGMPYGSMLKEKTKKVLKDLVLFLLPALLLINNFNLTNELISFAVGFMFIRGVSWKYKS
ncbi:MAG: hypothetical protein KJ623_04770 [Nanoarchaeota archaeon]|nr:hypothetical protein [Nanoarchaeota archaeon]MBU0963337.1 hypothetical protein [Nanoarchaeota archaeon]